ncbi:MAG: DUF1501 domain-containing protein [Candidatus Solibacter usitatus]|nr:DUF1501 domain-containing protein [Candidatus Solibacter usitatus]
MAQHTRYNRNRRDFLTDCFCGTGTLAFASMLAAEQARAARYNPLAPKPPHFPAKAKSFVFLFMAGGPSHLETFDPKPLLNKLDGQKRPAAFGDVQYQNVNSASRILGTKRTFQKYGRSGLEVSDLLPHTAEIADDICVLRSMHGDMVVHSAAQYQMMSGRVIPGFPAMGSWIAYGLGTESESLPAYVVMPDPHGTPEAGQPMYTQGFLPSVYQPAMFRPGKRPVLNLDLPEGVSLDRRRKTIDLIRSLNEANLAAEDQEFAARMSAYDTAFRMQTEAPEIFDLSNEPRETLDLYGVGNAQTDDYARRCLLARRLVERGVRFVCVVAGGGGAETEWDAHSDVERNHARMASLTDKPVAALIKDLKRRSLLDSTVVLWGGEFGRSPESEKGRGRDHHNTGFSMWVAGGGFKGGMSYGATDDIGLKAVEKPVHFRDLHATLLHQMGLQQDQLSYLHQGRKERLTEVQGEVIKDILR